MRIERELTGRIKGINQSNERWIWWLYTWMESHNGSFIMCNYYILIFFKKKKERKKEIGGKSLECLDSARKRLAELCVPMVYRSKAIWKKHSHLKGHQPHCIFVSVCKMHSFSFAWVPSSRSLVGKTRKDSSQTTLALALAVSLCRTDGGRQFTQQS